MSQNHPHDNIYNILGKLKSLEPTSAEVIKDKAQIIRESVEAQGSILAGLREVSATEQRLAKMFEESNFDKTTKAIEKSGKSEKSAKAIAATVGREKLGQKEMTRRSVAGRKKANENVEECAMCAAGTCEEHMHEERETLSTKHGKIYKGGTYGNSYDPGEGDVKPKHVPKAGQKGRPKKDAPMKASVPADPFGRTTGQVPKSKIKGTKIKGKGNMDWDSDVIAEKSVSKAQQKFMGMAHAMQKGEKIKGASPELKKVARTMKPGDTHDFAATKHKGLPQHVNESINFKGLADKHRMSMDECMKSLNRDYSHYQMTGECSDLLHGALHMHKQAMEEAKDRPDYMLPPGHPARTAPVKSLGDIHAQDAARSMHPPKLDAPKPASVHDELDEIAALAGITDEGNAFTGKLKNTPKGGSFELDGKTFKDTSNLDEAQCNECGMYESQCSCHEGNLFTKHLKDTPKGGDFEIDGKHYKDTSNLDEEPNEGNAFGLAVQQTPKGEHIKVHGKDTGEIKKENAALNELARLAGLKVESNDDWHDSLDGEREDPNGWEDDSDMAGKEDVTPGGNTYTYVFDDNNNTTKFTYTDANGQSQSFEIYYDSNVRGFDPHEVHDSTDPEHQKAALGNQIITHDDMPEIIDRLIAAPAGMNEANAPVVEPNEQPVNSGKKNTYRTMKASTMGPGEGDAGEKRMYPKAPDGDNAMTKPARGMPLDGKVQEGLEARLAAEYESIKKSSQ